MLEVKTVAAIGGVHYTLTGTLGADGIVRYTTATERGTEVSRSLTGLIRELEIEAEETRKMEAGQGVVTPTPAVLQEPEDDADPTEQPDDDDTDVLEEKAPRRRAKAGSAA